MKRIAATISTTLTVLLMTGCFTGIESTPKITANDVKKERAVQTPEDSYLNNITYESLEAWQPGKLFYVTDDKISLTLEPSATPAPKKTVRKLYIRQVHRLTNCNNAKG